MRGLSALVVLVLLGCEARLDLGTACARTSECPAPYVCAIGRCRSECVEQRDCPPGTTCLIDAVGVGSCSLPDDPSCDDDARCQAGLACIGGECVNVCLELTECPPGSECLRAASDGRARCVRPPGDDAGRTDAGEPDAPIDAGPPPPAPSPLAPRNGALTGSGLAPPARLTLRPRFRWLASSGADGYQLQVDDDCATPGLSTCAFDEPEVDVTVATLEHRPAEDLPISAGAPIGRRYYWRVRACSGPVCSAWSPVRYLDVGRVRSDFDGDGRSDTVVGAYQADGGETNEGQVFVYPGGAAIGDATRVTLDSPGDEAGAWFGVQVGFAGDVNADGFGDLVAGATLGDASVPDEGAAFLYLGGPGGLPLAPTLRLESPSEDGNGRFGVMTQPAGDVNGDGFTDVIVGAFREDVGATTEIGRAYLFYGSDAATGLAPSPDLALPCPVDQPSAHFGSYATTLGDLDADGYADFVVTAQEADGSTAATDTGLAFVYLGAAGGPDPGAAIRIDHPTMEVGAALGWSAAGAGDLDGDGYDDFAVGAPSETAIGAGAGAVHVFYGDAGATMARSRRLPSPSAVAGAHFGSSIAVGDVDGDGDADLVIGAHLESAGAASEGNVHVFAGGPSGVASAPVSTIDNPQNHAGGWFGYAVGAGGDVDGDGYDDAIAGAPSQSAPASREGNAFLFRGSATGLLTVPAPALDCPGNEASASFGFCVAL